MRLMNVPWDPACPCIIITDRGFGERMGMRVEVVGKGEGGGVGRGRGGEAEASDSIRLQRIFQQSAEASHRN